MKVARESRWGILASSIALCLMAGCAPQGKVGQGRVVEFNAAGGTVTVIEDSNPTDPANPRYDVVPARVLQLPKDPRAMGPAPVAGKLLRTDFQRCELVFFDIRTQGLKTVRCHLVRQQDGVQRDDSRLAGKSFPIVERQAGTITLYSPQRRILATVSVPQEYLALPDDTWRSGDEVRYYYKVDGRTLRLMNVTQTDIS